MTKANPAGGPSRTMTLALFGVAILVGVGLFLQRTVFVKQNLYGKKKAPSVEFITASGETETLDAYQGKVVLLNFWASWCAPCLQEMPDLERLSRRMEGKTDFVVLGASQDDTWEDIRLAARRFGVTFPVVHDPRGKAALEFGTEKLPETYLIDRDGKIVQHWIGAHAWSAPGYVERITAVVDAPNQQGGEG